MHRDRQRSVLPMTSLLVTLLVALSPAAGALAMEIHIPIDLPKLRRFAATVPAADGSLVPIDLVLRHDARGRLECGGECRVDGAPVRVSGKITRKGTTYRLSVGGIDERVRVRIQGALLPASGSLPRRPGDTALIRYRGPRGSVRSEERVTVFADLGLVTAVSLHPAVDGRGRITGTGTIVGGFGAPVATGRVAGRRKGLRLAWSLKADHQRISFTGTRSGDGYVGTLRAKLPPEDRRLADYPVADFTIPGAIAIVAPAAGEVIRKLPVTMEATLSGALDRTSVRLELLSPGGGKEDLSSRFSRVEDGVLRAQVSLPNPGEFTFVARGADSGGLLVEDRVSFIVEPFIDLVAVPGSVQAQASPVVANEPIAVEFRIENHGTIPSPPGVPVEVGFDPDPPADGGPPLPPIDLPVFRLPPILAGEEFRAEAIFGPPDSPLLEGPGTVTVEVDRGNAFPESDESNNQSSGPLNPGLSSWRDLAVRIVGFEVISLGSIRFEVAIDNVGTIDLANALIRFQVFTLIADPSDPTNPDRATLGPAQGLAVAGGGSGPCKPAGDPSDPGRIDVVADPLNVLAAGNGVVLEFDDWWETDPRGSSYNGATGWYKLCVEAIAADNHRLRWSAEPETDNQGHSAIGNNSDTLIWDLRQVPDYAAPPRGELRLRGFSLGQLRPGRMPLVSLYATNLAYPEFGAVDVQLSMEARGGRDDGMTGTGAVQTKIIGSHDPILTGFPFPSPDGRIPLSTHVTLTATFSTTDAAGQKQEVLTTSRTLAIDYRDVGIEGISLSPPEPHIYPWSQGEPPITAVVHLRNFSLEPVTGVGLGLTASPGGLLTRTSTGALDIPGDGTLAVPFEWMPTPLDTTRINDYVLAANLSVSGEPAGLPPDNQRSRTVQVYPKPKHYVLAVEPFYFPYAPGVSRMLRIRAFDQTQPSPVEFRLRVQEDLVGREEVRTIVDTTVSPLDSTTRTGWLEYPWTPQRAGYHVMRIFIDDVEKFVHRVDVHPQLDAVRDSQTIYFADDGEALATNRGGNGYTRAWTNADAIIGGGDAAGITAGEVHSFRIDDGTTDPNKYLMTLRYRVDFAGMVQSVAYVYADTFYRAGVSFGVRENSFCFEPTSPACDVLVHKDLWAVNSGGGIFEVLLGAIGDQLVGQGIDALVTTLLKKKLGQELAELAAGTLGVAIDLVLLAVDAADCDEEAKLDEFLEVTVLLENQKDYDAYLLMEARVAAAALGGDAWCYVDFYDYPVVHCGGVRKGLRLDFDSAFLTPLPR